MKARRFCTVFALGAVIGVLSAGCASSPARKHVNPSSTTASRVIANAVAKASAASSMSVTIYDQQPGLLAQGIEVSFSGPYSPRSGRGEMELKSQRMPLGRFLIGPSSVTIIPAALPSISAPGTAAELSFADVRRAGMDHPVQSYLALIADPGLWLDMLKGVEAARETTTVPAGFSKSLQVPRGAIDYQVRYDLAVAARSAGRLQGQALSYLAEFTGLSVLAGDAWVDKAGDLIGMRVVMASIPKRSALSTGKDGKAQRQKELLADAQSFLLRMKTVKTAPSSGAHTTQISRPLGSVASSAVPSGPSVSSTAAGCESAGSTGLDAAMVAHSGERITGTVDAHHCDIGVFIGPQSSGVVIDDATITNAEDHAIFVQNAKEVIIENSSVSLNPSPNAIMEHAVIPEDKAIELVGTVEAKVLDNSVSGRIDGGIGFGDDGIVDPGAINQGVAASSIGNEVVGNKLVSGSGGCAIVLSAFDQGEGVHGNIIEDNTIVNARPGGIVIAADAPYAVAEDNVVKGNVVEQAMLPGVIVHSNAIGDAVAGNSILDNILVSDGTDPEYGLHRTAGIALIGNVTPVVDTRIESNTITDEQVGVYEARAEHTILEANATSSVQYPVVNHPALVDGISKAR